MHTHPIMYYTLEGSVNGPPPDVTLIFCVFMLVTVCGLFFLWEDLPMASESKIDRSP